MWTEKKMVRPHAIDLHECRYAKNRGFMLRVK